MALAAANSPRSQVMKPSRSSMSQAAGSAAAAAAPGTGEVMTAAAAAEAIAVRPSPLGARAHRKAQPSQQCRGGERSRVLPYIFVPMLLFCLWWWWCWNGDERKKRERGQQAGLAAVVDSEERGERRRLWPGGGVKRRAGSGHPKIRETRGGREGDAVSRRKPNDYVEPERPTDGPGPIYRRVGSGSGG